MQNEITTSTVETASDAQASADLMQAAQSLVSTSTGEAITSTAETTIDAKPATANVKAAAKRVRAKPQAKQAAAAPIVVTPAKPTQAEREAQRVDQIDNARLARQAASGAVAAFYNGASRPFKSAGDAFSDINTSNAKPGPTGIGTQRQAALLIACILYGRGNFKPDASFVRGGFTVPANLVNPKLPASQTVSAQPESGALGNAIGLTVNFVSGPTTGKAQRDAVYSLNVANVYKLLLATFGDKQARASLDLLASYGVKAATTLLASLDKPAKQAKAG